MRCLEIAKAKVQICLLINKANWLQERLETRERK